METFPTTATVDDVEYSLIAHSGSSYTTKVSVTRYQFGDGYSQRTTQGINNRVRTWSVKWDNLTWAVGAVIIDFLKARNGTEAFYWTPPGETQAMWSCDTWNDTKEGPLMNVSATFVEEF